MVPVPAPVTGSVWKIVVEVGQRVEEFDELIILEAMKMEVPTVAPTTGTVAEILVSEGVGVTQGDVLVRLETAD